MYTDKKQSLGDGDGTQLLETFLQTEGTTQEGTPFLLPKGPISFVASLGAPGASEATLTLSVANKNDTNDWVPNAAGLFISAAAFSFETDSVADIYPYLWGRWDIAITGAGAACTVRMGN